MGEENETKKKEHGLNLGCVILFFVVLIFIGVIIAVTIPKDIFDSEDSSPSGFENITYRNVQRSDISMTYDMGLTSVTVVIQANNDIEEFSATVQLCDENGLVLQSKNVTYKNMVSGSRYEVYFALSISDRFDLSIYRVVDISGKVRR